MEPARERARTGIPSLKVKSNSVFGYYIEVTRANLRSVPADYTRKQTVANAERFVTPELADFEQKILSADERRIALELDIFTALRDEVAARADGLLALGARVAAADALAALAEVAHRNGYCRPAIDRYCPRSSRRCCRRPGPMSARSLPCRRSSVLCCWRPP